ncbi:hypothetical protein [Micromonospora sp. MH99]|uniref:hypothetical protein n=1 Tax=Micromonospora sp. MH99 TaxID=1945510 RepID=UPI001F3313C6|nr:hypothetical protein [Micromonospora sp. MH99]MCF0091224.1 hypothetical protein [Micromonospora sp. MH99]
MIRTGRQRFAAARSSGLYDTGRQALSELRRVPGVLRKGGADPQLSPQPGIDDLDRLLPKPKPPVSPPPSLGGIFAAIRAILSSWFGW